MIYAKGSHKIFFFNGIAIQEGWGVEAVPLRKKGLFSLTAQVPTAIKLEGGGGLKKKERKIAASLNNALKLMNRDLNKISRPLKYSFRVFVNFVKILG